MTTIRSQGSSPSRGAQPEDLPLDRAHRRPHRLGQELRRRPAPRSRQDVVGLDPLAAPEPTPRSPPALDDHLGAPASARGSPPPPRPRRARSASQQRARIDLRLPGGVEAAGDARRQPRLQSPALARPQPRRLEPEPPVQLVERVAAPPPRRGRAPRAARRRRRYGTARSASALELGGEGRPRFGRRDRRRVQRVLAPARLADRRDHPGRDLRGPLGGPRVEHDGPHPRARGAPGAGEADHAAADHEQLGGSVPALRSAASDILVASWARSVVRAAARPSLRRNCPDQVRTVGGASHPLSRSRPAPVDRSIVAPPRRGPPLASADRDTGHYAPARWQRRRDRLASRPPLLRLRRPDRPARARARCSRRALLGGVDLIQLRDKDADDDRLLAAAARLPRGRRPPRRSLPDQRPPRPGRGRAAPTASTSARTTPTSPRRGASPDPTRSSASPPTRREQLDAAAGQRSAGDRPDYLSVGPVWATPTKPGRPAAGPRLRPVRGRARLAPLVRDRRDRRGEPRRGRRRRARRASSSSGRSATPPIPRAAARGSLRHGLGTRVGVPS